MRAGTGPSQKTGPRSSGPESADWAAQTLNEPLSAGDAEAAFPVGLARQGDREPAELAAIGTLERDHLIRQRSGLRGDECLRGQSRRAALPDDDSILASRSLPTNSTPASSRTSPRSPPPAGTSTRRGAHRSE